MKHITKFTLAVILLSFSHFSYSQCTINASSSVIDTSVCGNCITLFAFGKGQGINVLSENFNGGAFSSTGWAASTQANWNNPCSANGVDGTTHIWMGSAAPVPRVITTKSFNFSTATAGVTVCFDMLYATQGNSTPCEGPDEPQEGVHLQYSIDGGNTWIDLQYWDPNGGNDPALVNWNNHCVILPAAAVTANTKIRWFQDADSGSDYDHWGIDNVNIYVNDPTYTITWSHDSYSYGLGKPGGANPNKVCPKTTTTYQVVMTNGTLVCKDSVKVLVKNPTIVVDAGTDTSVCSGQCVNLAGQAKVVEYPAGIKTYKNIAPDTVSVQSLGGLITQGAAVDINVQTLNMPNVLPNSIQSVCIDKIAMQGIFGSTASSLKFYLQCPDSTLVLLKDTGNVTGTSGLFTYTTLFRNTCFVPSGITFPASTSPYSNSYTSANSLNGMAGCTSNGIWTLLIVPTGTSIGTSLVITGWSITFNDPDKSYPANYVWSPTANMTNATTLTPRVCPTGTGYYKITASDTAGCVTKSDSVKITILPSCCNLTFQTVSKTNPTCGNNNGSAAVTMTGGTLPYTYIWSANAATGNSATASNLGAGTYTVTIQAGAGCQKDTSFTLAAPNTPNITAFTTANETCLGANDGKLLSGTATNAAGLSWGYALFSNPLAITPIASFPVNNLAPGTYILGIADPLNQNCRDTIIFTISAGPTCCNLVIQSSSATNPTCGNNNGSAGVTMAGGTLPYTYIWSANAATGNSASASGLGAGTYSVTIQAGAGCQKDTSFTLAAPNTPNITAFNTTNETCQGSNNGSITSATATNASGLSWGYALLSNPTAITPIGTFPVNNLAPGTYILGIADPLNQNCRDTVILTIAAGPICCTLAYQNVVVASPSCGNNNGNIAVSMTGGTGTYTYTWSANAATGNTGTASNLGAGTYTLTITSGVGCQKDTSFTLAAAALPNITAFNTSNETCLNQNNGSIVSATATNNAGLSWGYAPLSNPTAITPIASFPVTNLAPGTYILGIADPLNQSCADTVILTITAGPLCCNLSVSAVLTSPTCGNANGAVDVTVTQGSGNYTYAWNGTVQNQDTANVLAGSYALHLDDLTQGCSLDTTFVVNNSNGPQINSVSQSKESCAGLNDGSAWITATGTGLNYTWSNGLPNQATQTGLAAGTYFFTVSDINNCDIPGSVTVALGGSLTVNNQLTDPSCLGNDGGIDITSVLNGNPPYQYSLNYGTFGATKNFTSLGSGSYDVVVQDQKGCKDTVTYTLNAAVNNVSANLTSTDPSCVTNDGVVAISNANGGTAPYQYSFDGGAFGAATNFGSLGAGTYTVIVKDTKSCADTLVANLVAATSFTVAVTKIDPACGLNNGEFHLTINGGTAPFVITDGSGNQMPADITGIGQGRIDYTVKDANQCTQSGFVDLTAIPFVIQKLRGDTSICGDATVALDASNNPCYTHYLWSNGDTTAAITASTSGTYAVTITDDLGNAMYDSVHITLYALPAINLPEDTFIYEGQSITLNGTVTGGSGVGTYTWTPADLLTCSKCPSPKAVPKDSTTFTVIYTDQAGCVATDFINIAVLNDQSLYIPNAFSPNGDGKNDEFKIFARFVKEFNFSVFNRWGEKVFESNDINIGWDGRYKGVLQPPSVFVYYTTIVYLNNKTVHNQGGVTLIR